MPHPNSLFRFGAFELDGRTGEMHKSGGAGPRLVGQPLELLLYLLERPGELVTREELRQRLWPADSFADYYNSLNAAVNKVREALSDTSDPPRFIQILPRRGYRFIAAVDLCETGPLEAGAARRAMAAATASDIATQQPAAWSGLLTDPRTSTSIPHRHSRFLFALLQAMYLSFYVLAIANLRGVEATVQQLLPDHSWVFVLVIVTASIGIPLRLYLLSAAVFGYQGLASWFRKLFPAMFLLDELWSLSPLLILHRIGWGLVLVAVASLMFLPLSQRSVLLVGDDSD